MELAQTHGQRGEINAAIVSTTLLYHSKSLVVSDKCRRTLDSHSLPARRFRQSYKSVCKPFVGFAANTRVVENQRAIKKKARLSRSNSARRPAPAERHAASARRRQHRCLRSRHAAAAPGHAPAGSARAPSRAVQREEEEECSERGRGRGRPAGGRRRRALQDRAAAGRRRALRPRLRRRRVSFHAHARTPSVVGCICIAPCHPCV